MPRRRGRSARFASLRAIGAISAMLACLGSLRDCRIENGSVGTFPDLVVTDCEWSSFCPHLGRVITIRDLILRKIFQRFPPVCLPVSGQQQGDATRSPIADMLPTPRTLRAVCLALCVASARSGNGYAVSIEGALQAMSLTAGALDMTNAATSPMANGLTISAWIKYRDLTPTAPMAEFTIITANDANFWNGFGGKGGSCALTSSLCQTGPLAHQAKGFDSRPRRYVFKRPQLDHCDVARRHRPRQLEPLRYVV